MLASMHGSTLEFVRISAFAFHLYQLLHTKSYTLILNTIHIHRPRNLDVVHAPEYSYPELLEKLLL